METDFARQYYESAVRNHWWFIGRARMVANMLRRIAVREGKVVDLGAGSTSLFPPGFYVVKLDMVVPSDVDGHFVRGSVESLPFRSCSFSGVGLFDVLEHVTSPAAVLAEARRVTAPGGFLVYTVPAFNQLWSHHDEIVGHVRRYHPNEVSGLLEAGGFKTVWTSMFYGFLLGPALIRKLARLESPMTMPSARINSLLTWVAKRSADSASRSNHRLGLSISGIAFRP